MTIPRRAPERPPDPVAHRRQREWELTQALDSLRHAQARLELLGDRQDAVRTVHRYRDELAAELARLAEVDEDAVTMKRFFNEKDRHDESTTSSSSHHPVIGFDTIDERDGGRNDR